MTGARGLEEAENYNFEWKMDPAHGLSCKVTVSPRAPPLILYQSLYRRKIDMLYNIDVRRWGKFGCSGVEIIPNKLVSN